MRYKITLKLVDPNRNILPVNYQFELGSWLYHLLNNPEGALLAALKATGKANDSTPFRSFVFSHLLVPDRKIEGDRLFIQGEHVSLIFSTLPDSKLAPAVLATFQDAAFLLGDRNSQVPFQVTKIEMLQEPVFTDKMSFKTLSPIHLSMKVKGRRNEVFLSPEDEQFSEIFYENLYAKFKIVHGFDYQSDRTSGKFKLRSDVTQKGIVMHAGNRAQSKLIGFQLRFRLQADPELLKVGYFLGFGEKNHLGFGCCEHL